MLTIINKQINNMDLVAVGMDFNSQIKTKIINIPLYKPFNFFAIIIKSFKVETKKINIFGRFVDKNE